MFIGFVSHKSVWTQCLLEEGKMGSLEDGNI